MKNEPQELQEIRQLLSKLPETPVSSNFTARVMQAVEREEIHRPHRWNVLAWNWHALLPRAAVAAVVLGIAGFAYQQYEAGSQRAEIARNIKQIASVKPPSLDALQNFDAIQRMSQPAHPDEELLSLLQ